MTEQFYNHLQKDDVISFLDTWTEEESPEIFECDIDVAKYEAEYMIRERLLDVIQAWEKKERIVEEAVEQLTKIFNEKCIVFSRNCNIVDNILKGDSLPEEEKSNYKYLIYRV